MIWNILVQEYKIEHLSLVDFFAVSDDDDDKNSAACDGSFAC